jgi:hypothetical protein
VGIVHREQAQLRRAQNVFGLPVCHRPGFQLFDHLLHGLPVGKHGEVVRRCRKVMGLRLFQPFHAEHLVTPFAGSDIDAAYRFGPAKFGIGSSRSVLYLRQDDAIRAAHEGRNHK